MTPEQQRIAIAEACGWKSVRSEFSMKSWINSDGNHVGIGTDSLPNYLNDLNAMHDAEEHAIHNLMDADEWGEYGMLLKRSHPHGLFLNGEVDYHDLATILHATASQRAEAFLRTIGKWEEAK
jgi:hypothetical protein